MPTLLGHFILLLITTSVTNLIPTVQSKCIEAEKQSLIDFNKTLVFDSFYRSKLCSTWDSSTDCCSWIGVTCSTDGHVVGLDLSEELFSTNIDNSSSLFQLQHLQSLNFAHNYFNFSSIPSAIGKLTELRYLNLSDASFSGDIPIEIARLTRLKVLDLSNYDLVVNVNFGLLIQNHTQLTELHLNSVNISGRQGSDWCEAISSSLPNLQVLSLSYCGLSGPVCESIVKLQSLSQIDLSSNSFYAPVSTVFANFTNLTSLNLRGSDLLGIFPKEIFQIPTLRSVDLSQNSELQGSLPEFSSNNGSLEFLDISVTKFSGVLPDSIGNLKMLSNLDLSGCNFTAAIPKSLGNLTQLEYLTLSSNKFSSPIGSIQWDKLIKLERLDLANNLLYGSIPSSLFSIPSVSDLILSGNHFSGQLPEFSNVTSSLLGYLDLSSNYLEGSIPVSIFNLPGLKRIDFSSNNLTHFPFYGLQESRNLSYLSLSHNSLSDSISTNTSLPSLLQIRNLYLASNKLKTFPSFLKNQSQLSYLDLSDNQISGLIPNWVWELPSLATLDLCCNKFVGLESPLLGSTYNLLRIDLHSNQLQGEIPRFLRGRYLDYSRNNFSSPIPIDIGDHFISATEYLSLSSNNLNGMIPKSICNASGVVLDLSNNSLSGIIPQCLTQKSSIRVIDLRRNNLIGSIPDTFPQGCGLETLALGRNKIQGRFPKSLANCSSLKCLDLGINQIADTFPCQLKSISTLAVLLLRSNKFYGHIGCLENNCTWRELQVIDLAHNSFDGEIPGASFTTWQAMVVAKGDDYPYALGLSAQDESIRRGPIFSVGRNGRYMYNGWARIKYDDVITTTSKGQEMDLEKILSIFTSIDFSDNNFKGSIPKEIGQLRSLYALNLSGNDLTGGIPTSFGNMRAIESLDLSNNQLSGHIPQQLANLTFLSYLNVSNNQLTGRIPTGTQFSTFPNTSFGGNKGLWGPPLTATDTTIVSPPPGSSSNQNSGDDQIDWNVISAEIGFTIGFGIAIGSLLLCKRWRKWYYRATFNLLFKILPQLEHRFGNHRRHVHINQRFWRR